MLVDACSQHRNHSDRERSDESQHAKCDERELPAVGEHHRDENEQEREVEDERDGRAGHEFADVLHRMHSRDQRAGGSVLEVRQMQAQEVTKYFTTEHCVDSVPGVQDEILSKPAHGGVEEHEHHQADGDRDERALRLVHDHLIDDHLREERRGKADELDEE